MESYLWIIWVKLAGALWIIGGKLGNSLIFLFFGYQRRLEIADPLNGAETYTRQYSPGVPQRVKIASRCRIASGVSGPVMKLRLHAAICRVDFGAF